MGNSFEIFADPQAALRRICVNPGDRQPVALASTTVLLMQVLPAILNGAQIR